MNVIEERIRAAAQAAARTVGPDQVPPLRLPPARQRSRLFNSSWARRLAPVTAAAAVAAVIVAIVAISGIMQRQPARTGTPGRATPSSSAASYVAAGLIPPHYVALADQANGPSYAFVRATATGTTLATIKPPDPDGTFVAVTAAADDRTFVLDEQPLVAAPGSVSQASQPRTFYRLRLAADGAEASLTRLFALPKGYTVTGGALSPNGSRLALAIQHGNVSVDGLQDLVLYNLAAGTARIWSATGLIGFLPEFANAISWAGNGQTLAFDWYAGVVEGQTRLLDITAPGTNLVADSRLALDQPTQGWACQSSAVLTPDGQTIVCGALAASAKSISNTQVGYAEYSAVTGKITHVLGRGLTGPQGPILSWTNASGSVLIGAFTAPADSGRFSFGVITQNRFIPLPWSPTLSVTSVAW